MPADTARRAALSWPIARGQGAIAAMTGLGFAGGALACAVTAVAAVLADQFSVHPSRAPAVSD